MRSLLRFVVILAVPIVLTMGVVRLVTMPWYPTLEYSQSNFPPDPLGMDPERRLQLARDCIRFLNLPQGSKLLDDLQLPDGSQAFNAREISHMDDVKAVYDRLTLFALLVSLAAAGAGWALQRYWTSSALWEALAGGGRITMMLLILLALWMGSGFEAFFTIFHGFFFEGDSWLFLGTDTLIRLFPIKFWFDAGMIIAGIVGIVSLGLALFSRQMRNKSA